MQIFNVHLITSKIKNNLKIVIYINKLLLIIITINNCVISNYILIINVFTMQ